MSERPPAPSAPKAPAAPRPGVGSREIASRGRARVVAPIDLEVSTGKVAGRDRILLYGTGGIGKSTLAAFLPSPLFVDTEGGTRRLKVKRVEASDWLTLRGTLAALLQSPPEGVKTIVLDTITRAQAMAEEHVVDNYLDEKGRPVESIERFSFGKGWQFLADEMKLLLADVDRLAAVGLNVCLIAHDLSSNVPNPSGDDFLRWEPNLYAGAKGGRGDVRNFIKGWADHVLFVAYDRHVKDGKASGGGTRTIYTSEHATHVAKTRAHGAPETIDFTLDAAPAIWSTLGIS